MPSKNYDDKGHFIPDDTPVEVPLHITKEPDEHVKMALAIRREMDVALQKQQHETFEEQMDFEVEEDEDIFPTSQYELQEMQEEFFDEPGEAVHTAEQEEPAKEIENGKKKEEVTEKNEREETTEPRYPEGAS